MNILNDLRKQKNLKEEKCVNDVIIVPLQITFDHLYLFTIRNKACYFLVLALTDFGVRFYELSC